MRSPELPTVSVVIPTLLSEPLLLECLRSLSQQTVLPTEIIIVYTESFPHEPSLLAELKCLIAPFCIRIFRTPVGGQVQQRTYGISRSTSDFLLCLDDDVTLCPSAIETFLFYSTGFNAKTSVAFGPVYCSAQNSKPLVNPPTLLQSFLRLLLDTLIGGASFGSSKFGSISPSLQVYPHPPQYLELPCQRVSFLPGGCLFIKRSDAITSNYYPFKGKAYCEDIILSLLLARSGVALYILRDVNAFIFDSSNHKEQSLRLENEQPVRIYISRNLQGNLWRTRALYQVRKYKDFLTTLLR